MKRILIAATVIGMMTAPVLSKTLTLKTSNGTVVKFTNIKKFSEEEVSGYTGDFTVNGTKDKSSYIAVCYIEGTPRTKMYDVDLVVKDMRMTIDSNLIKKLYKNPPGNKMVPGAVAYFFHKSVCK